MALDLTLLSSQLEDALRASRLLAEQHGQALIQPEHLLYVLLDHDSTLYATLERNGVACSALLGELSARINGAAGPPLEPGRKPVSSQPLRRLLEQSLHHVSQRSSEQTPSQAEPFDILLAATDEAEAAGTSVSSISLRTMLREAGICRQALESILAKQQNLREAIKPEGDSRAATAAPRALERFGFDMTEAARAGSLMPVVGRDEEIRSLIQTLLRKSKNNPVLVGDPGTGKTAIVEGLAARIASGDVPESLRHCKLVSLDLAALVAGAKYRGEFEERLRDVIEEVRLKRGEIILFLDELHQLVGAGGTEGGMDAANMLKPALARGELRCIGATTFNEYRERIEKDGALARRFEQVHVKEPSDELMLHILRGIRARYEAFHNVRLTDEALQAAVKLSRRHLRDRFFPDKAIDVIDAATARLRMQIESKPTHLDQQERLLLRKRADLLSLQSAGFSDQQQKAVAAVEAEIAALAPQVQKMAAQWEAQRNASAELKQTLAAIETQTALLATAEAAADVARAAEIRFGSLHYLQQQKEHLLHSASTATDEAIIEREVLPSHIAEVIAERSGVPASRLLESERERLQQLDERLAARVFGQPEAVQAVTEAAQRMRTDLQLRRSPSSFLFVGPTGVGKTELAKALAEALFDDERALIRIDMGEYKDKSSTASLIGSRPGLVGSDEGGFLTEQVRRAPYSIVLFDEVEKGHPEILDMLLGVLDEGRLTDAKGRFCDFSNTIVVFTSNLGVRESMGAADEQQRQQIISDVVRASLRPELYNRIGQLVAFRSLERPELERIVGVQLDALARKLDEDRNIQLSVSPQALASLAECSYDPEYGARPAGRVIQQLVLAPLATALLAQEIEPGQSVLLDLEGEVLTFNVIGDAETPTADQAIGSIPDQTSPLVVTAR